MEDGPIVVRSALSDAVWVTGSEGSMRHLTVLLVLVLVGLGAGQSWVQNAFFPADESRSAPRSLSLPDPARTPGAINPAVTQDSIGKTICVRGWTRTVRPPADITEALKRRQLAEWGYADRRLGHYEEDHLVPLSIGGSPDDPRNLWPEPRAAADGWDAGRKDELEVALARLVCAGRIGLADAQRVIARDWIAAYGRYVGSDR